jgi:hypothetical protein
MSLLGEARRDRGGPGRGGARESSVGVPRRPGGAEAAARRHLPRQRGARAQVHPDPREMRGLLDQMSAS